MQLQLWTDENRNEFQIATFCGMTLCILTAAYQRFWEIYRYRGCSNSSEIFHHLQNL